MRAYERLIPPARRRAAPEAFVALGLDRLHRVLLDADRAPESILEAVAEHAALRGVALAEPDHVGSGAGVPDDPAFFLQWGMANDGGFEAGAVAGADIDAIAGWELETGDGSVVIAVLDTGLNLDEPDVAGQLWTHPTEVPDNGLDDDGNGYVDDVHGWDFAAADADPSDEHGHGTNVAGIAAAAGDDGVGYAGVCWDCRILVARNLDANNLGYYSWWAESMVYAVDQGADVLNMSEGGVANDSVLLAGSAYAAAAGVPVVVAMMNSNDSTPFYPAAHPQNIAVGATDTADRRAAPFSWGGGSNHGPHIDVVAPGNLVYGLGLDPGEYGTWWSGTSQATPAVAGLVALLLTVRPELDPEQVRAYLRDGAEDQVGRPGEDIAGFDVFHGAGRIDLRASLALLFADLGDGDGDGVAPVDGDCDDTDPAVLPGADELCDGLDTDCDGALPDGERDFDGDGALACEDDCDDGDASVGPQMVEDDAESCDDELDNDCDELIDRDDPECPKGCRSCEAPSGGRSSNRGSFAVLLFAAFGLRLRRRR